ncbi:MAG: tetratricopeptide repeat protein, partial [Steroidobacteraceae bacterium]
MERIRRSLRALTAAALGPLAALGLNACAAVQHGRLPASGSAPGAAAQPPTAYPSPGSPAAPEGPYTAPARQFRLGTAATALVAQAHAQATSGEYAAAGATLERALRIEPENPLLWVELGRVQLQERNAGQADGMARKA